MGGYDENDPASGRGWVVLLQAASSDTSTSATAMIRPSHAIVPDFFNRENQHPTCQTLSARECTLLSGGYLGTGSNLLDRAERPSPEAA